MAYTIEHFDGASVPAPWTAITAGTATLTLSDSNLTGALVTSGDAVAIYRSIDITTSQIVQVTARATGNIFPKMQLVRSTSVPAPDLRANITAKQLVAISQYTPASIRYLRFGYRDATSTSQNWNESTNGWATGNTVVSMQNGIPTDDYFTYGIEIDGPGARIRMFALHSATGTTLSTDHGPRLVALTDWVSFSSMVNGSGAGQTYLLIGWPETDAFAAQSFQIEKIEESSGTLFDAWTAQKGANADPYQIARHHTYDPRSSNWLPDGRGTIAIAVGAGGSYDAANVKFGSVLKDDDGTYWQTYSSENGSGSTSISIASAATPDGPWTKYASNPIISPVAASNRTQFEGNTLLKDWNEADANKRYKIIATGIDGSSVHRALLYTAPDPDGPWTYQGVLLDVTGTETSIDVVGAPVLVGSTYHFFYTCLVGGVRVVRRASGASIAVGALTRAGTTLLSDGDNSAQSDVSAVSGRTITVGSTTGFVKDAPVVFDNDANVDVYGLSRVRKVLSSTQLELYHAIPGAAAGGQLRTVNRGAILQLDGVQSYGGEFLWFVTWGKVFDSHATYRALFENSAVLRAANIDAAPAIDWAATPAAPHGRLAWGSRESSAHVRLVNLPFAASSTTVTKTLTATAVLQQRFSRTVAFTAVLEASVPTTPSSYKFEHFDGTAVPAPWTALTAGSGTITLTDSNLVGTLAVLGDSAAIYRQVDLTKSQIFMMSARSPTAMPFASMRLVRMSSPPTSSARTTYNTAALAQISVYTSTLQYLRLQYRDNTSTLLNWNEATQAWASGGTVLSIPREVPQDDYSIYGMEIDGANARLRLFVIHTATGTSLSTAMGPRLAALTDWVPFSSMINGTGTDPVYLVLGTPENNFLGTTSFQIEWFAEADGTKLHAWADQRASGAYTVSHHTTYDPRLPYWLPEGRGTKALATGPSAYDALGVRWGSVFKDDNGTLYQTYAGEASGSVVSICLASAASEDGPWTKYASNPIIPVTASSNRTRFTNSTLIKDWTETDAQRRYKIIATGLDGSLVGRALLFSAPAPTGPWTYWGVFLQATADESGSVEMVGAPLYDGGVWHFFYNCTVSGQGVARRVTCATIAPGSAVREGVNILTDGANAGVSNVTAVSGRTITVASTTGFARDHVVVYDNDASAANSGLSRVRKVLSATQLELYHAIPGAAAGGQLRSATAGKSTALQRVIPYDGEYLWFTTVSKPFQGHGTFDADYETSGVYRSASLSSAPVFDWLAYPNVTLGRPDWDSDIAMENIRLVSAPLTAPAGGATRTLTVSAVLRKRLTSTLVATGVLRQRLTRTVTFTAVVEVASPAPTSTFNFEHFDGATVPAPWTAITAGAGTITLSDSNLVGTIPSAGAAAAVYRPIDLTQSQIVQVCARSSSAAPVARLQLVRMASAPTPATRATFTAAQLAQITTYLPSQRYIRMQYRNSSNVDQNWNETGFVWSSSTTTISMPAPTPLDDYCIYGFEIDGPNARLRMFALHTATGTTVSSTYGPRFVGLTDWVSFSSMANGSGAGQVYLILGWPETDGFVSSNAYQVEWFAEASGQKFHGWVNQKGNTPSNYDISHHYTYDPRMPHWMPYGRGTRAIPLGSSGSYDDSGTHWGSVLLDDDGTYWMTYAADSFTSHGTVALASATTPDGPWTKYAGNPIIPFELGTNHEQFTANTLMKDWTETDPNKRYKIIAIGFDSALVDRALLYTAPHPTGPWTYQGVFLEADFGETNLGFRGTPLLINGEFHFFYNCDFAGVKGARRFITPRIEVGVGAREGVWLITSGNGAASDVTAVSGRTITLASTTGFAKEQVVLFDNNTSADSYGLSRVRKVLNSTQLELYHSIPGAAAGGQLRTANYGNDTALQRVLHYGGEYLWFVTVFKVFTSHPTFNAHYESSGIWRSPDLNTPPVFDWQGYPNATMGRLAWNNLQSVENLRVVSLPLGNPNTVVTKTVLANAVLRKRTTRTLTVSAELEVVGGGGGTRITTELSVSGVLRGRLTRNLVVSAVLGSGGGTSRPIGSSSFNKLHGRNTSGELFRLERNLQYGNAGMAFTDAMPNDEAYLFPPENTKELWNRTREMADRYGYEVRFDEQGHLTLQPRNAPHKRLDFVTGDFTVTPAGLQTLPHVAAFGGTYLSWPSGAFTVVKTVSAARIDIVFPRGPNLGAFSVVVQRVSDNATVATGTVTPASSTTQFYYEQRMTADGVNSCVSTVYSGPFDAYRVTLTASGSTALARQLDCLLLYYIDPSTPLLSEILDTANTALEVRADSAMDDMRNMVTVVGRRKAALTDSEKLGNNPENPEGEFVVERQVVAGSIVDPASDTFIGYPRESVIYDEKITDPDMAQYLANAFTFRYRAPWSDATIDHPLLPMVQLRDPLYCNEDTHKTITTGVVRYPTTITHRLTPTSARTTIETTAYADFAAYEPREDVDVDTYFGGQPIANVSLSYTSLTGQTVTNKPLRSVAEYLTGQHHVGTAAITAGSPPYLNLGAAPWPPIPGTVQVGPVNLAIPNEAAPFLLPFFVDITTYVNTQRANYTDPVKGTQTPIVGAFDIPANGTLDLHLGLTYDVSSVEIQTLSITKESEWVEVVLPDGSTRQEIVYWYRANAGQVYTASSVNNGTTPFYFEWYPDTQNIRIGRNGGDNRGGLDTYIIKIVYRATVGTASHPYLADTPYHHVTNVVYNDAMRRIYLPWKEGDGSAGYQIPAGLTNMLYRYRPYYPAGGSSDPYAGVSPFYDPYTSELGYLVTAKFDALISGFYRVSIRAYDKEKAWQDSTVVAWLTNPSGDADDPEEHWSFLQAGTKSYTWDGVDQRGEWNAYQSEYYAIQAQGVFELGEKPVVGKGFYAWNREHVGGTPAPSAFIADLRDAAGKPVFGQGTYGTWFLVVECRNAALKRIATDPANATDEVKRQYPRVVATGGAQPTKLYGPNNGGTTEAYVFTHLGPPTRATVEVKDWASGLAFNDQDQAAVALETNWGATTNGAPIDTDATIHNTKPVRLRLTVEPRAGTLWSGKEGEAQVMVYRHAHLRAAIMDQFVQFAGVNYPDSNTEQRTVVSRRMFNDRHTVVYKDSNFRRAATLKSTTYPSGTAEWIFIPRYFRKQFRLSGVTEAIRFGDYLQLEEVPGWDASKQLAGKRARLQIAFMAYLFYLSVYTQDRSGRYCWAINRNFLDQTKIIKNAYADWYDPSSSATPPAAANATTYRAEWPVDYMTQHRRTVVTRQWTNEPGWQAAQRTKFGFTVGSIGDKLLRHKWQDHEPTATTLNGSAWPALSTDNQTTFHKNVLVNDGLRVPSGYATNRQLGTFGGASQLGTWTWETAPSWIPCVSRDFHPFYKLPPMVSPAPDGPSQSGFVWRTGNTYAFVDRNPAQPYSENKSQTIGDDPAALEVWASAVYDHSSSYSGSPSATGTRFWPNSQVKYKTFPTVTVGGTVMDYIRQEDNCVHYEELRGMYSVGKKPQQQPIKLSAGSPYYINQMDYYQFESIRNPWQSVYPAYRAFITKFFTMKFRSEYFWESGTMFPVKRHGQEYLAATNVDWTRYDVSDLNLRTQLYYDSGGWTGWKDDVSNSGTSDPNYKLYSTLKTVFSEDGQPVAVGPRLPVTKDMYFHLVLVPERRGDV